MLTIHNGKDFLIRILFRQIDSMFFLDDADRELITDNIDESLERVEKCFICVKNKYYFDPATKDVYFNPLHTGQFSIFLYYVANTIYKNSGYSDTCDKIYALNKAMSSADLFYAVNLPEVFFFDHPQGSVIGRGTFSDYFTFSQGCTVGNNKNIYPTLGKGVIMFSNSKILGNCKVGNWVIISANTYIKDQDIPDHSMVFGTSPNLIIKSSKEKTEEIVNARFLIK